MVYIVNFIEIGVNVLIETCELKICILMKNLNILRHTIKNTKFIIDKIFLPNSHPMSYDLRRGIFRKIIRKWSNK